MPPTSVYFLKRYGGSKRATGSGLQEAKIGLEANLILDKEVNQLIKRGLDQAKIMSTFGSISHTPP